MRSLIDERVVRGFARVLGAASTPLLILMMASLILHIHYSRDLLDFPVDLVRLLFLPPGVSDPAGLAVAAAILVIIASLSIRMALYLVGLAFTLSFLLQLVAVVLGAVLALTPPLNTFNATDSQILTELLATALSASISAAETIGLEVAGWLSSQPSLAPLIASYNLMAIAAMWLDKRLAGIYGEASETLPRVGLHSVKPCGGGEWVRCVKCGARARADELSRLAEDECRPYRIPENSLLRYAVIGGGPGILAGAILFRHKTRHIGFLVRVSSVAASTTLLMLMGVMG